LIDFESSLTKLFRGVIVEWEAATTGDGGSVDISYQVGGLDGSYTSLQTSAVSGTEYTLSGVTGRSISIKVTLNKSTSTAGPKLKRVYVRAVPLQQQYRRGAYRIDCSGRDGHGHVQFNDGSQSVKDGQDMLNDLKTSATSTTPISITDTLGTYTGVVELDSFAASEVRPEEYVVEFRAREV
jgi:hypothetical protein